MDFSAWEKLIKEYGPIAGFLLALNVWQAYQIRRLILWNSQRHDEEIKRMATVHSRLLDHILGPQPGSDSAPSIKDLKKLGDAHSPEKR